MYYHAAAAPYGRSGVVSGLALTPTVALRNLYEQWRVHDALISRGTRVDLHFHFAGPIRPPVRHVPRPMGDPVFDALADYACTVIARAGLLTSRSDRTERARLDEYGRLSRQLFAVEHCLAVDLARTVPELSMSERESGARAVLALAAYWTDRSELIGLTSGDAHRLLGVRPGDSMGQVLYDHAVTALTNAVKATPQLNDRGVGLGIGLRAS